MKTPAPQTAGIIDDDIIDVRDLIRRVGRGVPLIIGMALLGLAAALGAVLAARARPPALSTLYFALPPEPSTTTAPSEATAFQPQDFLSADVLQEAARRTGLANPEQVGQQLKGMVDVGGIIPPGVAKEREKQRASGQIVPPYRPAEYRATLVTGSGLELTAPERDRLLTEIVDRFSEKYRQATRQLPPALGHVFADLETADYPEYPALLKAEIASLKALLAPLFKQPDNAAARAADRQLTALESQLPLLADAIETADLTKNARLALEQAKLRQAGLAAKEEQLQIAEQSVAEVLNLLPSENTTRSPEKIQPGEYLTSKMVETRSSLKRLQVEKQVLLARIKRLDAQLAGPTAGLTRMQARLDELASAYAKAVSDLRLVITHPSRPDSTGAILITQPAFTPVNQMSLGRAGLLGLILGAVLGFGISLLRPIPSKTNL